MSEKKESRFIRFANLAIPLLLVIYILSFGPAAAFVFAPDGMVEKPEYLDGLLTFYAPILWCTKRNDFLNELFRQYFEFCNSPDT